MTDPIYYSTHYFKATETLKRKIEISFDPEGQKFCLNTY